MVRYEKSKTILNRVKNGPDEYFGATFNMNLYRGCQHQCIYCDSRSECYGIEDFSDIIVKENALELLESELRSKRKRGTICFGSMNDPYMPLERRLEMSRRALEIIRKYKFPVHIITKGSLITRDIDILRDIGGTYAAVSFTITTVDDSLSGKTEPYAPKSSERLAAMKELSDAGIYTGVLISPVLPFITDYVDNIKDTVMKAKMAGAGYAMCWMGMTLRDRQREYYYRELDRNFPGVKEKYIKTYGENYNCPVPGYGHAMDKFKGFCSAVGLPVRMIFFEDDNFGQQQMF